MVERLALDAVVAQQSLGHRLRVGEDLARLRDETLVAVAHEVAHLREMNHGPRFWKLTGEICRSVQSAREWLEANGTDLYRYGR